MSVPERCISCPLNGTGFPLRAITFCGHSVLTPLPESTGARIYSGTPTHMYVPGPDCPYRRIDEKDARIAALEDALDSIGTAALSEAEDRGSFALVERVELMQALRMLEGGEV